MKRAYSLCPLYLTFCPLLVAPALAQPEIEPHSFDPVTVTGTRAPTDLSRAPLIIDIYRAR